MRRKPNTNIKSDPERFYSAPNIQIDFSNIDCAHPSQLQSEEANNEAAVRKQMDAAKNSAHRTVFGVKLNDCELIDLSGLSLLIQKYCQPNQLTILDLRCNQLCSISELPAFTSLKYLYLHGNELEIDCLQFIPLQLENLTVHGNPLSLIVDYRTHFINHFKELKHLDFCPITKNERKWAENAVVDLTVKRQNVVLQKMKTKGQIDEYREKMKQEQQKQKEELEKRMKKDQM
ncbi:U2_small nuclear ribonucleoprotein A' putative [Hexamita inflata]|uniref:Leucine-rich repeat-containing protein 51 n=1 Tax=Hexamita inflata TaxID=28002 RepID=A0AA86PWC7_9EUKA|nr:U2 small nuclear ribonucleoprotein A' putative [Hexamita inflata]